MFLILLKTKIVHVFLCNMVRKMTLTMFVEPNVEGWTIKDAVEHLSDSTTICLDSNESFFILYSKGENDSRGCYVEKCFLVTTIGLITLCSTDQSVRKGMGWSN